MQKATANDSRSALKVELTVKSSVSRGTMNDQIQIKKMTTRLFKDIRPAPLIIIDSCSVPRHAFTLALGATLQRRERVDLDTQSNILSYLPLLLVL